MHEVKQVIAQPGGSGKLYPVGLLVQGNPQAEIRRVKVQLFFQLHQVGSHNHQAAPGGPVASQRRIGVVLAQDAGR